MPSRLLIHFGKQLKIFNIKQKIKFLTQNKFKFKYF